MKPRFCLALILTFFANFALAQEIGGTVVISTGASDNALKSESNILSERQDTYEIGLTGQYENPFLTSAARYTVEDQRFAEGSQEDRTFVDGSASLFLGTTSSPIDLSFNHSRRSLLSAPDDLNVSTNIDNREIFSMTPRLKRVLGANLLTASADVTRIDFTKNIFNNSHRVTTKVSWLRDISKVSNSRLEVKQAKVSFENFEIANYRYSSSMLAYSTELRNLDYVLATGFNQSERNIGDTYSSPAYLVSIGYKSAHHQFQLSSSQKITDSSMGGGNNSGVNSDPTSDGSFSVDQIERLSTEFSWTTQVICVRCTAGITVYSNHDDYLVLPDEGRQKGAALSFSYSFSNASSISYRFNEMKQSFEGALEGRDYSYVTHVLSFSVDLWKSLAFKIFYENEARESNGGYRNYDENFIGGAISYSF